MKISLTLDVIESTVTPWIIIGPGTGCSKVGLDHALGCAINTCIIFRLV